MAHDKRERAHFFVPRKFAFPIRESREKNRQQEKSQVEIQPRRSSMTGGRPASCRQSYCV